SRAERGILPAPPGPLPRGSDPFEKIPRSARDDSSLQDDSSLRDGSSLRDDSSARHDNSAYPHPHPFRYPAPRSTRPGSAPVALASAMTGTPFTSTHCIPSESWLGLSNVARSRTV